MDYPRALAWLYGTQLTGIKLGLESMSRLLAASGIAPRGRFLHVAGTNGKGSVCAMLEAVCRAQGYRTALYTSPHLITFRERMRLDGTLIPDAAVAAGLTALHEATRAWEQPPTFFELTTALAMDWFAREGAEIVVWETGLGGRLDATNVVTPAVSALTAIDLDHTGWLGNTLAEIAGEKAGIIKPGVPVVSVAQAPEAAAVIERAARERNAPLRVITAPVGAEYAVGLAGTHQRLNAALALAALDAAGIPAKEAARRTGLASPDWPGRFQRLEKGGIILDGAHNPAAATRLAQTWREEFGPAARATVILGILRDKDSEAICRSLASIAARFITVDVRSPRTMSANALAAIVSKFAPAIECTIAADLSAALSAARQQGETALVTGSLFLVGEALALLTPGAPPPEVSWQ